MSLVKKFLVEVILLVFFIIGTTQILKYLYVNPIIYTGYNEAVSLINSFIDNPQNIRPKNVKDPRDFWCYDSRVIPQFNFNIQTDGEVVQSKFIISRYRGATSEGVPYSTIDISLGIPESPTIQETKDKAKKFIREPNMASALNEQLPIAGFDEFKKFPEFPNGLKEIRIREDSLTWFFNGKELGKISKTYELKDLRYSLLSLLSPGEPLPGPLWSLALLLFGCDGVFPVFTILLLFSLLLSTWVAVIFAKRFSNSFYGLLGANLIFLLSFLTLNFLTPFIGLFFLN